MKNLAAGHQSPHEDECAIDHPTRMRIASYAKPTIATTANIFKCLGDLERLGLLALLASGRACVSDLAASTGSEISAVSQRLRLLKSAGLVAQQRRGKHIYYSLKDSHVARLIEEGFQHALEPESRSHTPSPGASKERRAGK